MSDSSYGSVMVEGVVYIDEREIAKRDAEIERLLEEERVADAEIERLRGALETVKTVEDNIIEAAAKKDDEIERLRELVHGTIDRNGNLASENARLRGARRELVVALHTLASHFENALYAFRDDDEARKKAEGDIALAMEIASRHNHNGNRQ